MSMHNKPLTSEEEAGIRAHGLERGIGKPSQLVDVFRHGMAFGQKSERERIAQWLEGQGQPGYADNIRFWD